MARKTITIAEVGEIRTFGDNGKALPIWGEDETKYECYKTQLFEHLTVGATVECEVEEKPSKDGRFINHNIQGVFKDGQPVGVQRQGGGGRSYGKSPETEAMVQWHSDRRTLVMQVPEYIKAGLPVPIDIQDSAIRIMREWASIPSSEKPLMPHTAGQGVAPAPKPIPAGIPQPRTSRDDAEDMDAAFGGTVATGKGPPFASKGAFLTAAYEKWGIVATKVGAILTTADMQNLDKAWEKLTAKMKEQNNEQGNTSMP